MLGRGPPPTAYEHLIEAALPSLRPHGRLAAVAVVGLALPLVSRRSVGCRAACAPLACAGACGRSWLLLLPPPASAAGASSCLGLSWVARGVPRQQVFVEQLGKVGGGGCLLGVRRLGAAGAGVCSHACPPMLVGSSRKHSGPLILIVFFSEPDIVGHFPPRLFLEFVPAPLLKRRLNCCLKAFPPHALVSVPFVVGLGLGGAAGSSPLPRLPAAVAAAGCCVLTAPCPPLCLAPSLAAVTAVAGLWCVGGGWVAVSGAMLP